MQEKKQVFIVSEIDLNNNHIKLRLDSFLSTQLKSSKNQIQSLIKSGCVWVNEGVCKKNGTILKKDDHIIVQSHHISLEEHQTPFLQKNPSPQAHAFEEIDIVYQDLDLLIINKPPHLVVHPAPSVREPTLLDWLKTHSYILHTLSGEERYGIIHRLDKQTSGALCVARSSLAYNDLPQQLKSREMGRYYLALIDMPLKHNQQIQCFMGRCPSNRLKMTKIHLRDGMSLPKGVRDSKSSFVKLATSDNGAIELIAIKLHSGRTHQIRTHLESISRHILGDNLYGYKPSHANFYYQQRILLHAFLLYLKHPRTQEFCTFNAPIFTDMLKFLQTHFTKDTPNGNIMEILTPHYVMRAFECFS